MNQKLQIYTEADYLRAHMTAIAGEYRPKPAALESLKQQLTSILRKWTRSQMRARG